MPDSPRLRLGARASALARWQADHVTARLAERGVFVELVPITTTGDVTSGPIGQIGGEGLFTKEIQRALLDRRVDLAVHSLKDLPTEQVPGLALTAVPERGPAGDVLVSAVADSIDTLPAEARVGTGSMRRRAQLLHRRGDLVMLELRGNVDTRLRKLDEGQCEAIVLAEAGLTRLGLTDRIRCVIPQSVMLPAVGQGALGLETRAADQDTIEAVVQLDHRPTHAAVLAERALLAALRAGCLAPVGAFGSVDDQGTLQLTAAVLSADGSQRIESTAGGPLEDSVSIGQRVAEDLVGQGARNLIAEARGA